MPDTYNKNPESLAAKVTSNDLDPTVRTPDGQVDTVQTALNKMRAEYDEHEIQPTKSEREAESLRIATQIINEIDASLQPGYEPKLFTQTQMDKLENIVRLSAKSWHRENDRASYYRTYVIFLSGIIAFLVFLVVILKASK